MLKEDHGLTEIKDKWRLSKDKRNCAEDRAVLENKGRLATLAARND